MESRLRLLRNLCIILGLFLWLGQPGRVSGENKRAFLADYVQVCYNLNNGLFSDEANCVLQSSDGFIWVASYAGLQRYDGQNFQLMLDNNGRAVSRTRKLFEDSVHRLWIGTNNNGIYVNENGIISKYRQVDSASVRAFAEDQEGRIYVGTSEGVGSLGKDETVTWVEDGRLKDCLIVSLTRDQDDQVWGVTYRGDVFKLRGMQVVEYYPVEYFDGRNCICVYADPSGPVYVGTSGSVLLCYDQGGFSSWSTGADSYITSVQRASDGKLWICSDKGLGFFDENKRYHEIGGALLEKSLENIIEDYEHNYWVSSSRYGLLHLVRSEFQNLTFAGQQPSDVINATQAYNGQLYLATEDGLLALDQDNQAVENQLTRLLQGIRLRDLLADKQGNLWIATYKKYGLIRYKDGEWENWSVAQGLPTEKVRTLLERANGDIAVGTGNGVAIMHEGRLERTYTGKQGLNNGVILSMAEDDAGNLYVGTDGAGIFKIDPYDSITNINYTDNVIRMGTILSLCWDREDQLLWISDGSGILVMQQGSVHRINAGRLDLSNISDIKLIGDNIWLFTASGIHIMKAKALQVSAINDYTFLKYRDNLHSTLTVNARNQLTKNGYLYLSCSRGALGLDPSKILLDQVNPKFAVDKLEIDGKRLNGQVFRDTKVVNLPQNFNRLTIKVAVLTYSNKGTDIQYYLEGMDPQPLNVQGKNVVEVSYNNLPGGSYVFHVKAKPSGENAPVTETAIELQKKRHFTELPWVRTLLVLVLILLVVYATSEYERKEERMAMEAAQKKALEEENRRIEYQTLTDQAIHAIAKTIDAKDKYTNGHSVRVAQYAREIAKEEKWNPEEQEKLFYTALLHDIGKISVPDKILNKPGRLNEEEYAIIKQHTTSGYNILKDMTSIRYIMDGAHYHHERYDGTGYPEGLKGEQIPVVARIICVADTVDAMYSARVYRQEMSLEYIEGELVRCSGAQFDPRFAQDMLNVLKRGYKAKDVLDPVDLVEDPKDLAALEAKFKN